MPQAEFETLIKDSSQEVKNFFHTLKLLDGLEATPTELSIPLKLVAELILLEKIIKTDGYSLYIDWATPNNNLSGPSLREGTPGRIGIRYKRPNEGESLPVDATSEQPSRAVDF